MAHFKNIFLLSIIAISIISVVFFLYRYESVTVNFFPQNSDLIFQGIFNNATSLAELGNTTRSLGISNISGINANQNATILNKNKTNEPLDDMDSISNPIDTLTKMIVSILEKSTIDNSKISKDQGLKNYYDLKGTWNLAIRGDKFSNFTGVILLNNTYNHITKNYSLNLVTSSADNITFEATNQIIKIKG